MQVKKIEGLHLTATNKKHIIQLIQNGWKSGGTKRIQYEILDQDGDIYTLKVYTKDSNDYGKQFWRVGNYVVQVK